jgi:hypothetical protein
MTTEEITENELKLALMKADLYLKTKQGWWETPRNMAIIIGVVAALFGAVTGILGYKLGSQPPMTVIVHLQP